MRDSIQKELPKHIIIESKARKIFIVDYKELNGGKVVLLEREPSDVKYVLLINDSTLPVYFDAFPENGLPISAGEQSEQCEGVAFPTSCKEEDWVLFIECKYAYSLKQATDKTNGYPQKMINQIIATVDYFRSKEIINKSKKAHAIVSFPNLIEAFDSWFFSGEHNPETILRSHKVIIRATNSAIIISSKRIKLNASTS